VASVVRLTTSRQIRKVIGMYVCEEIVFDLVKLIFIILIFIFVLINFCFDIEENISAVPAALSSMALGFRSARFRIANWLSKASVASKAHSILP
jgi:preprotein translocase subunit SecF